MDGLTKPPVAIVALDFADEATATALVEELGELCRFYKVGSELFTAAGPSVITTLRDFGCEVMLDLKLHDIPNTVAGAVAAAGRLGVSILTVHAAGGAAMVRAAAEAARGEPRIFAVTLLTSLDGPAIEGVWGRESLDLSREVVRLARMAADAGAAGVVASGSEIEALRNALGEDFQVLVPGVRLVGSEAGDQSRVVTPAEAARLGADYVVIGRTVTKAAARRTAMQKVLAELGGSAGLRTADTSRSSVLD